jgi:hypothetical protein
MLPGVVLAIITLRRRALAAAWRCGSLRRLLHRALADLLLCLLRLLYTHLLHLSPALRLLFAGALLALGTRLLLCLLLPGTLFALGTRLLLCLLLALPRLRLRLRRPLPRHLLLARPLLLGGGVSLPILLRTDLLLSLLLSLRLPRLLLWQRLGAGTWSRADISGPDLSFGWPAR